MTLVWLTSIRDWLRTTQVAVGLALCVGASAADAAERHQLGVYAPGTSIALSIPRLVLTGATSIEIDGNPFQGAFGVFGRTVSFTIPANLAGTRHDIVVTDTSGGSARLLGIWEFETPSQGHALIALQGETGIRAGKAGQISYYQSGGTLDFDMANGRLSGGVSFTASGNSAQPNGSTFELNSVYLGSRNTLWGDDIAIRAGNQYLDTLGQLIDQSDRRGVSVTLTDPSGQYDAKAFVTQASRSTGASNLLGIEDSRDRLFGFSGVVRPVSGAPFQLGLTGFSGAAPVLPGASQSGAAHGAGLSFSTPIADAPFDISGHFDTSWHETDAGSNRGTALGLDLNWSIEGAQPDIEQTISLRYEKIGTAFYSPLNPDLITGEEGVALSYARYAQEFGLEASAGLAFTNADGPANAPTDRMNEYSVFATYSPETFTGGFLNGTTFFVSANNLRQIRVDTPAGASPAQNHAIWQLATGFSRFQKTNSVSVMYTYDDIDILGGTANDRKVHTINGLFSGMIGTNLDASVSGVLRRNITSSSTTHEAELTGSLKWSAIPDKLDIALGLGGAWYEDPATSDYLHAFQEAAWSFNDNLALVASADYRDGPSVLRPAPGDGWSFGLAIRANLARFGLF